MPHTHIGLGTCCMERDALLGGQRLHEVAHHLEHTRERKRHRPLVDETIAAVRELDHVVGERRQSERRAVHEIHLAHLDVHQRATASAAQLFGEQQDRVERRSHIVHDFDQQLQCVRTGEPTRELLCAILLQLRLQTLDRLEDARDLARVQGADIPREFFDEQAAHQGKQLMRGRPDGSRRLGDAIILHSTFDRVGQ
jgi:hypothetical protein